MADSRNVFSGTRLQNLSAYRNYVIGTNKTKTDQGIIYGSSYYKKYYGTIDAEVYFGDNYIEDIHDLVWDIDQNTQPLFGYNSYVYDEIAQGSRLVHGEFSLNATGAGVMDSIIASATKSQHFPEQYVISVNDNERETVSDKPNTGTVTSDTPERSAIWTPRFDIDIMLMGNKRGGRSAHIVLENVTVTKSRSGITSDGGVFQGRYSFIARDYSTID